MTLLTSEVVLRMLSTSEVPTQRHHLGIHIQTAVFSSLHVGVSIAT